MPVAIEQYDHESQPTTLASIAGRATPLVIRGLCAQWPLVAAARQSDTAFAQLLAGHDSGAEVDTLLMPVQEQGVVGYNGDLSGFNYSHHRVTVTQGLQRLAHYSQHGQPSPGLAIQSAPIAKALPGLLPDHRIAFLDADVMPRIWVGNRVTTPAHFDEFHNMAVVVCGSRRFTVFPPDQARNLYIGPLDFAPTGAAISMAPLEAVDDPRYPRLRTALDHALQAELLPGDAIYIPPLWWHHVASLQPLNALVNYWWKPPTAGGYDPGTALGALMHCILSFGSLTPAEKAGWRSLLDYYVFGNDDPAAHIPLAVQGMLGTLSADQAAALKRAIRNYL
jgi:hypothetical protein